MLPGFSRASPLFLPVVVVAAAAALVIDGELSTERRGEREMPVKVCVIHERETQVQ